MNEPTRERIEHWREWEAPADGVARQIADMALRALDAEQDLEKRKLWALEAQEETEQAGARIRQLEADLRDVYEGLLPYVIGIPELDTPAKMHRRRIEALLTTPPPDSEPAVPEAINIVFDGPPGPTAGRFVEAETDDGKSVRVGEWIERDDGLWALRIDRALSAGVPEAVREIMLELAKAREKFPQWPDDPIHAAAIVQEEAGELVQATLQSVYEPDKADYSHAQKEAIQLGAMAVRFIENMGAYRTPPRHQHDDRAIAEQGGQRVPEGWKLVPVEPTAQMWADGYVEYERAMLSSRHNVTEAERRKWEAMIAAAPQPEHGESDE